MVLPTVGVIAVGAFLGARALAKKHPTAAAATQQLVQATVGTMTQTVSASGTLAPAATKDLNFTASGTVTAVNVKAGQNVVKGQVLATIDSAALQSAVVQAQAQVAADESTLSTDESNDASSAQLTADQATLSSDEAQLTSTNTALAGASLVAPITGKVASVNLTVGEQLGSTGDSSTARSGTGTGTGNTDPAASDSASSAASSSTSSGSSAEIEIVSPSLVVNLSVDDTEIAKIKTGQPATVSASSSSSSTDSSNRGGGQFAAAATATSTGAGTAAKVTSVGVIASASSGVATFPVVVQITGTRAGLYSGATAQVSIVYKELTDVIQVPTLAVSQANGQSFVTVSANGVKTKRTVTTGVTSNGEVQITSGLKAGTQVVMTIPSAVTPRGSNSNNGGNNEGKGTGAFPGGAGGPPVVFQGPNP